jgi:hypothetical protein
MASAEREPIRGSGAEPPAGSRGRAPGGGQGAKPPEGGDNFYFNQYDFSLNLLHMKRNQPAAISSHFHQFFIVQATGIRQNHNQL